MAIIKQTVLTLDFITNTVKSRFKAILNTFKRLFLKKQNRVAPQKIREKARFFIFALYRKNLPSFSVHHFLAPEKRLVFYIFSRLNIFNGFLQSKLFFPLYPKTHNNLEEFNLLLNLADTDNNPDIKFILNLALLSGIRRGEMAALKWDDVNFDESYIYIHESRIVLQGEEYIKPPKTDAGIRKIYVPDKLINILKEYQYRYSVNKLKYGAKFKDKGYVVSKPNGEPFSPSGISNNYQRFMKRHNEKIRYLKFHGLRHTYASILIEQGENPKTVQHNLGHADVALTLQVYSHSYDSAQINAAKKLDETIEKLKKSG